MKIIYLKDKAMFVFVSDIEDCRKEKSPAAVFQKVTVDEVGEDNLITSKTGYTSNGGTVMITDPDAEVLEVLLP